MTEIIKETTVETQENHNIPVVNTVSSRDATGYQTAEYLVYFFFGILEALLIFRFIFKLMGANYSSAFIGLIYKLTDIFILPFEGIFSRLFTKGVGTTSVIEPSTLVAIVVYAVIAMGLVKLIRIISGKQQSTAQLVS